MKSNKLKLINQTRDDLFLLKKTASSNHSKKTKTNHDCYFNNNKKVAYESHLASLFIKFITPSFMSPLKKISDLIYPDFKKTMLEFKAQNYSISTQMHEHLMKDFNLKVLFKSSIVEEFYDSILKCLNSTSIKDFYKQMSIHRAYVKFFWDSGGKVKPVMQQMIDAKWTASINLTKLMDDAQKLRQDETYFQDRIRYDLPKDLKKTWKNIGIFPLDKYESFSKEDKDQFEDQLPLHEPGMLQHVMTIEGNFSATAMLDYDLPVICGPSGVMAMRLALANQASLDKTEHQLFNFASALYNVVIGAHSIDESFIIANNTGYSRYIRGNYTSIIPTVIMENPEFRYLWAVIQELNKKYSDILYPPILQYSSIVKIRKQQSQAMILSKVENKNVDLIDEKRVKNTFSQVRTRLKLDDKNPCITLNGGQQMLSKSTDTTFSSQQSKDTKSEAKKSDKSIVYYPVTEYKKDYWALIYPKLSDKNFIAILKVFGALFHVKLNLSDSRGYRAIVTIIDNDMASTLNRPYTSKEKLALQMILGLVAEAFEKAGCPIVQQQVAGNNSQSVTPEGFIQIGNANEPNMLHGHIIVRGDPNKAYIGDVKLNGPAPNILFNMRGDGAEEGNKAKLKWSNEGMNVVANAVSEKLKIVIQDNIALLNGLEIVSLRPLLNMSAQPASNALNDSSVVLKM